MRRRLRPWRESTGQIRGLVVSIENINESKLASLELERNTRFTGAVLENIQDGIVACNAEGRLTLFNEATRRFHGVESEPIPPEEWSEKYDLYDSDGRTPLKMGQIPLFRALAGERVVGQEMVIAPCGAQARRVVAYATALYDAGGSKLGALASMHDITEETVAREKWQEANALYKAIFDHTFQFCGIVNVDGTLRQANKTALEFAGLDNADVAGLPFWETHWWQVDQDTPTKIEDAVRRACAGEFIRYEIDVQGKDGVRIPIDFSLKPVRDENGIVTLIIAEGWDISDMRHSEKALSRSKAELELILNNVPTKIFFKDDENRILRLNEPAARSLGKSVSEIEGKSTYDLFPALAAEYHKDDLEVINTGNEKLGIIEKYAPKGEKVGWSRTDKVPYTDPDTGQRFIFVASSDITSEIDAQNALKESEKKHRSLYNKTPVMMHSIDAKDHLVSVSDFWLEKLGYTRREVLGRRSMGFMTPESREKAEQLFPSFWERGIYKNLEFQFVTKSGEILDVLLSAIAEYDDGKPCGAMSVLIDVTERKLVERQLAQAQKMESVGQLTGGLAHDFNNLLGVVLGNLQLIERSINDGKSQRRLTAALNAVDRGAELTRRLLAFSRRQSLETELFNPNPLIEGMSDLLHRSLGEEISLECHLGDNVANVRSDTSQLESAILNLAVNARDAMPDGGKLTIESEMAQLSARHETVEDDVTPGEYVVIAVTDTGIGISKDALSKIFEPFFTTKEVGKGSGLGLSMVYGFVKQTGGHVRVYSELGHGTTVRMYIPVDTDTQEQQAPSETVVELPPSTGEIILIVEDQDEVREVATGLLQDLGYKTISARSGQEGLAILESSRRIDLLFTDIVMPGTLDGPALAERARQLRPDLPVVFTTGYAEASVLREGDIKKASNLVTKPYRREILASRIQQALFSAHTSTDHGLSESSDQATFA